MAPDASIVVGLFLRVSRTPRPRYLPPEHRYHHRHLHRATHPRALSLRHHEPFHPARTLPSNALSRKRVSELREQSKRHDDHAQTVRDSESCFGDYLSNSRSLHVELCRPFDFWGVLDGAGSRRGSYYRRWT